MHCGWQRLAVTEPDVDTVRSQLDRGLLLSIAVLAIDRDHLGTQRPQRARTGGTGNANTGNADPQLVPGRIMGRC